MKEEMKTENLNSDQADVRWRSEQLVFVFNWAAVKTETFKNYTLWKR
ncbi:MAG TPA: hypothetical protein VLF89_04120 [Candidatus Saccharimonadales bacterium]|nr:hypothetical protein [Candidatus Saccharimonadales bacterium]